MWLLELLTVGIVNAWGTTYYLLWSVNSNNPVDMKSKGARTADDEFTWNIGSLDDNVNNYYFTLSTSDSYTNMISTSTCGGGDIISDILNDKAQQEWSQTYYFYRIHANGDYNNVTLTYQISTGKYTIAVGGGGGGGSTPKVWLGATPEQSVLSGHLAERGCETVTNWGFYYSTTGGITQSQVSTDFDGSKTNILEVACSNPSIGTDFSVSNPAFNGISGTSGAPQKVYVVAYAVNENGLVISDELALNYCGQSFTLSGTGSVSATTSYPWEATTVTASNATGAATYTWQLYSYDATAYLPQSTDQTTEYEYVFQQTSNANEYVHKGAYDTTGGKTNKYTMYVTASDGTCDATREYTFSVVPGPNESCGN